MYSQNADLNRKESIDTRNIPANELYFKPQSKAQKIELIQTIFSVHKETKLKTNNKKSLLSDNQKNLAIKNSRVKS